jgi:hypothetical protein
MPVEEMNHGKGRERRLNELAMFDRTDKGVQ